MIGGKRMRIVIAPDSFKGSIGAEAAAAAMAAGVRRAYPAAEIVEIPVADGGEGTLELLVHAQGGEYRDFPVRDPLGNVIEAPLGLIDGGRVAVIEMARASGLQLVPPALRNPLVTSTYGTGQLLGAALDLGCRELIVTIGGSATVDGGLGLLAALGAKFHDGQGKELAPIGQSLPLLAEIDIEGLDGRLADCRFVIASDVDTPLCGPSGAAPVFGPQKGAGPAMVNILAQGLDVFARLTRDVTGVELADMPGAGAAGGLGGAMVAYLGGEMRAGIDVVLDTLALDEYLPGTDLVMTGEGRLDGQSAMGKAPMGVAKRARAIKCPAVAIVGSIGPGYEATLRQGLAGVFSIMPEPMDLGAAMENAAPLIEDAAFRVMHFFMYCQGG